jgi:hypothetical protein
MSSDPRATPTLLPCPFCGGKAVVERYGNSRQFSIYRCVACGCGLETGEISGYGRIWNNRVPAPPNAIREAAEGEREACAKIADRRADSSNKDCERLSFDGSTGTLECSLSHRGDCLCQEHQEEAEAIAVAIRARGEEKGNG